jgi:hypothetical protein
MWVCFCLLGWSGLRANSNRAVFLYSHVLPSLGVLVLLALHTSDNVLTSTLSTSQWIASALLLVWLIEMLCSAIYVVEALHVPTEKTKTASAVAKQQEKAKDVQQQIEQANELEKGKENAEANQAPSDPRPCRPHYSLAEAGLRAEAAFFRIDFSHWPSSQMDNFVAGAYVRFRQSEGEALRRS